MVGGLISTFAVELGTFTLIFFLSFELLDDEEELLFLAPIFTPGTFISALTVGTEGLIWTFFLFEDEDEDEELLFLPPSLTSGAFI
jgi:hypothetical protein